MVAINDKESNDIELVRSIIIFASYRIYGRVNTNGLKSTL